MRVCVCVVKGDQTQVTQVQHNFTFSAALRQLSFLTAVHRFGCCCLLQLDACENGPVCADEKTWHDRGRKKETDKQEYKKKDLRHVEKQTHTTKKKLSKGSYYKKEKNNNNKKKCERKGNSSTSHFDLCHVYSPQNESKEQNYQGTIIE